MRPLQIRSMLAVLFAAIAAAACAGATGETARAVAPDPVRSGAETHTGHVGTAPVSAQAPFTTADVQFMTDMIGHHAQALEMARMVPTHGASASVGILAARITNAQQDEIATMQRWLSDRGQPVPEVSETGMVAMPGGGHAMHHAAMPGMLSGAQMQQLSEARGEDFDQLFLTFMIQHHRGAVAMVQELFGTYGAVQDEAVFKIASEVNVDQTTEINRMQKMLAELIFVEPAR